MSRLDSTVIVNRRTFFRAVAGLAVALVLVGGSLAGLSEDVLDFRDWSGPSVEDRGGKVGLAAVPRRFPEARVGPVPAPSDGLADITRGPAGRVSAERRVADRPAQRPRRRRASAPQRPAPAAPAAPQPGSAPVPAAAPAPAPAPAPLQVAAAPAPPPPAPAAAPTRPVGRSGKAKPVHKRVQEAEPAVQVQTRTGAVATPVAPAPVSAPGKGPDGLGAPGHRKASSPGRGKHDRDHHGLGHVRASGVRGR